MLTILSFSSFKLKLHICTKRFQRFSGQHKKTKKTKKRAHIQSLVIAHVMGPAKKEMMSGS